MSPLSAQDAATALPSPASAALSSRWYQRIEARIVALFLALLLLVQAVSFLLIQGSVDAAAMAAVASELQVGERVFATVLAQRADRFSEATRLLASDYGLRAALASDDRETITSALQNHGDRIGAQVAFLTDAKFALRAATRADAVRYSKLLAPDQAAERDGDRPQIFALDGRPFLLVKAPVKAPLIIGWVAMAFPVDRQVLEAAQKVLSLDAALVRTSGNGNWEILEVTGSLGGQERELAAALPPGPRPDTADLQWMGGGSQFRGRLVPLAGEGGQQIYVVLARSVTEALAPYRSLKITLLLLAVGGIGMFAAGSVFTARRIAGPIQTLSAAASVLAHGDYATPIAAGTRDEIGGLARALENMRLAIRAREESITHLAFWDPLTDLPNRVQFANRVAADLQAVAGQQNPCAILMLDLDRFKQVNDVLGQAFGDRVLKRVAQRLAGECLDEGDVLARLGGDEFAVLVPGAKEDGANAKARRILRALELAFTVDSQSVDLGAGVGIALFPQDGTDVDTLLTHAEMAMYVAKRRKGGAVRYDSTFDTSSEASLSLLSQLRRAVAGNELRLYLQPKARLHDGAIIGAEALVRWAHPQRGILAPSEFIPFAEQTGFIRDITAWMLEHGIAWLARAEVRELQWRLAVNLSTRDLLDQELPARLQLQLQRHHVDAGRLCLEITESAIMDDPQRAQGTLAQLHDMGVKLSIDDFGTGYSSLAYLQRLKVDELKIDRSFVGAMESDAGDAMIVRSTIELGHNLGLTVVAEGVETDRAWRLLQQLGCDEAQGYLIGRPAPADEMTTLHLPLPLPAAPVPASETHGA